LSALADDVRQMTAVRGSIGSQGIVQERSNFLRGGGKNILEALSKEANCQRWHGRHGRRAAPCATMAGASFLGIDVDAERIKKRLKTGYCDFMVNNLARRYDSQECRPQKRSRLCRGWSATVLT